MAGSNHYLSDHHYYGWGRMETLITHVLNGLPMPNESYMEVYHICFNACAGVSSIPPPFPAQNDERRGADLVLQLLDYTIREWLQNFIIENGTKDPILEIYVNAWEKFSVSAKVLNGMFQYLHRDTPTGLWRNMMNLNAFSQTLKKNGIYHFVINLWHQNVFSVIKPKILQELTDFVREEWQGSSEGRIGVKQFRTIIESLIDLTQSVNTFNSMSPAPNSNSSTQDGSEYYEEVESAYLKELECFYAVESKAFLDTENGTEDYVLKVQSWMESEEQRTSQLMHSTTFPKVVHILNDILVRNQFGTFLSEFKNLLSSYSRNELESFSSKFSVFWESVSRINEKLDALRDTYEVDILTYANGRLELLTHENEEDPDAYLKELMALDQKYGDLTRLGLKNEVTFVGAFSTAMHDAVNSNPYVKKFGSKTSIYLAKSCDRILRNLFRGKVTRAGTETELDQLVSVLNYVDEKDVFMECYTRDLAHRLISQGSELEDAEASMIIKLKPLYGFEITVKLDRMLGDIAQSQNLTQEYKDWIQKGKDESNFQFEARILSNVFWPFSPTQESVEFPKELSDVLMSFTHFYSTKHSGRKLTWLTERSSGEIKTNGFKQGFNFVVSGYQVTILLLFNYLDSISLHEILNSTQIPQELFPQIVEPLLQIGILKKLTQGVHESYMLNLAFDNPKIRIYLNKSLKTEKNRDDKKVEQNCFAEQRHYIEACIMRIAKLRKAVSEVELLKEVCSKLEKYFKADPIIMKKCISGLVERGYLKRDEYEAGVYHYVV